MTASDGEGLRSRISKDCKMVEEGRSWKDRGPPVSCTSTTHMYIVSRSLKKSLRQARTMVQTSKTDHFFKLAPFWSPLTDLIDFGMAGKLLTSATR